MTQEERIERISFKRQKRNDLILLTLLKNLKTFDYIKNLSYLCTVKQLKRYRIMAQEVITGEHLNLWRLEYWKWFFPHPNYDPVNNGRIHLFGNFYWRK